MGWSGRSHCPPAPPSTGTLRLCQLPQTISALAALRTSRAGSVQPARLLGHGRQQPVPLADGLRALHTEDPMAAAGVFEDTPAAQLLVQHEETDNV